MYDPILAPDHTCCNESKTIKKTITMTNLFLVLLSFLAHDVYKKNIFCIWIWSLQIRYWNSHFYAKLIVGDISLFTWRHFAMNNQTAVMLVSLPFLWEKNSSQATSLLCCNKLGDLLSCWPYKWKRSIYITRSGI